MRIACYANQKLPNFSVRLIAGALSEWGYDVPAALAEAGLPATALRDPAGEVTGRQELAFQSVCARLTGDNPARWIELGKRYRLLTHAPDCYGLMMQTAPTVEQALRQGLRFGELHFTLSEPAGIYEAGRLTGVRGLLGEVAPELHRFVVLRDLGSMLMVMHDLWGGPFPFARIEVPFGAADARIIASYLPDTRIQTNAPSLACHWSVPLDRPPPMSDPFMHELYLGKCEGMANEARTGGDLVARLTGLLAAANGHLGLDEAARMLGLSPRTLQRRLEARALTYRDITRMGRYRAACRLLAETNAPIGRIAFDVGYETLSSFNHAFRAQAGVTPSRYRHAVGLAA